jgi:hypothetical protein
VQTNKFRSGRRVLRMVSIYKALNPRSFQLQFKNSYFKTEKVRMCYNSFGPAEWFCELSGSVEDKDIS